MDLNYALRCVNHFVIDQKVDSYWGIVFGNGCLVRDLKISLSEVDFHKSVDYWKDQDYAWSFCTDKSTEAELDLAFVFPDNLDRSAQKGEEN